MIFFVLGFCSGTHLRIEKKNKKLLQKKPNWGIYNFKYYIKRDHNFKLSMHNAVKI